MNRTKGNIIMLCLCFVAVSCNRTVERYDEPRVRENYIQAYYSIDSLSFHSFSASDNSLKLVGKGKWLSASENDYYKDYYDDKHNTIPLALGATAAYSNCFDKIEIVSNTDFNGIAAGGSLSAVVKFVALSPCKWLFSGCESCYDWANIPDDYTKCKYVIPEGKVRLALYPVDKLVSELTADDLVLLMYRPGGYFGFVFLESPENKDHIITITFFEKDKNYSVKKSLHFD